MLQITDNRTIEPVSPANSFALRCDSGVSLVQTWGMSAGAVVPQVFFGGITPFTYVQTAGLVLGAAVAAHDVTFNNGLPGNPARDIAAYRRSSATQVAVAGTAIPSLAHDFYRLTEFSKKSAAEAQVGISVGLVVLGAAVVHMGVKAWQGRRNQRAQVLSNLA